MRKITSRDPEIRKTIAALRRSSRDARQLAEATRTPFYVFKDGKIVDLNRSAARRKKAS